MNAVFGVATPLPLKGFPRGRVRLRMRNDDFLVAFVKSARKIRRFIVAEKDGFWIPMIGCEQAANYKVVVKK